MTQTTVTSALRRTGRALLGLPTAAACLLTLFAPAACSIMDEGPDATGGTEAQVVFTLRLDAPATAVTKATWDEVYDDEDGTPYENAIDPARLQVMICNADGTTYYPLQNLSFTPDSSDDTGTTYTFVGSIDLSEAESNGLTSGNSYKIMVLANCPDIADYTGLGDLTYTYGQTDQLKTYLPMWGVTTAELSLTPGERQLLGSIDLLRAVAKVEVLLDDNDELNDYSISAASIGPYNTTGYCLPAGWNSVTETKELHRQEGSTGSPGSYRPYASSSEGNSLAFSSPNNDGSYIVYLPEYDNTDTNPAEISITINGKDYPIYFKTYTDGKPQEGTDYNIVRNHLYRYTITGIDENGGLRFRALIEDLENGGDYYYEY